MIELSITKQANTDRHSGDKHGKGYISNRTGIGKKEQAALILYDNGMIRACNQASGDLLCCSGSELIGQHITRVLPQLVRTKLVENKRANSYLRFLSRIGYCYKVVNLRGGSFKGEIFFNDVEYLDWHYLRVIICLVR